MLKLLENRGLSAAVHVPLAGEQILRADPGRPEPPVLVLEPRGGRGRPARTFQGVDRGRVPVVVQAAARALDRLTREDLGLLEVQLVRRPDLVGLLEHVHAAPGHEAERLTGGLHRVPQ